jgi:hypothetical protein
MSALVAIVVVSTLNVVPFNVNQVQATYVVSVAEIVLPSAAIWIFVQAISSSCFQSQVFFSASVTNLFVEFVSSMSSASSEALSKNLAMSVCVATTVVSMSITQVLEL